MSTVRANIARFLVRGIVGLGFIFHSLTMKLAQPTSWMGPHGFAAPWLQGFVTFLELVGGAALIAGFLTPLVALLLGIEMLVAIVRFHLPMGGHFVGGPFSFEVPLVYLVVMIALLIAGPGGLSVDALLFRRR